MTNPLEKIWSLHFQPTGIRIDDLTTAQVKAIFGCMKPTEIVNWMVWQEDSDEWVPAPQAIAPLLKSASEPQKQKPVTPPVSRQESFGNPSFEIDTLSFETPTPTARPASTRPAVECAGTTTGKSMTNGTGSGAGSGTGKTPFKPGFKVFINCNGQLQTNVTEHISMNTIVLQQPLPSNFQGNLDVVLMNGPKELHIRCALKMTEGDSRRELTIEFCKRIDVLRSWITGGTVGRLVA